METNGKEYKRKGNTAVKAESTNTDSDSDVEMDMR